jgi:hypothetical protein
VLAHGRATFPYTTECRIFRSLHSTLPTITRLAVLKLGVPRSAELEDSPIFQIVSSTNHLQTLILNDSFHLPSIRALDPEQNPNNLVLRVITEEPVFRVRLWDRVERVCTMATNRASRGVKLLLVTLVDTTGRGPRDPKEGVRTQGTCHAR